MCVEYYLLADKTASEVSRYSNEMLRMGWHLHGSPFYGKSGYCQAYVREEA